MKRTLLLSIVLLTMTIFLQAQIRVGIIGLDTSHSPAFVKMMNAKEPKPEFTGFKVVAAYPYGSHTIKASYERIPKFQKEVEEYGVEIVSSIAELLKKVDCVMLETNDGNTHFDQAAEVFAAGKIIFVDKPIGANLVQSIAVYELAKHYNIPIFSSSTLRFTKMNQELRKGDHGDIIGADCYSPSTNEASHADLYWYGIHGVETLFTIMGTGCKKVSSLSTEESDVAIGVWNDGRLGTFRGIRKGKHSFGGSVLTAKGMMTSGGYEGYEPLLKEILKFFRTKQSPVSREETFEIYTFMEAANQSKVQGGKSIEMKDVYAKAEKSAKKLVAKKLKGK